MEGEKATLFLKYLAAALAGIIFGFLVIQFLYYLQYDKISGMVYTLQNGNFSVEDFVVVAACAFLGLALGHIVMIRGLVATQRSHLDDLQQEMTDKDKLLGYAAHVLRTPATSIKWGMESVLDEDYGPVSKEQKDILKKIYGSTRELLDLVENYIDLSKLKLHIFQVSLAMVPVDAAEQSIKNILEIYNIQAKAKNITIDYEFEAPKDLASTPFVLLDKQRFINSIENIVENAIDYSSAGGSISIRVGIKENHFFVTVKDTGIGIGKEDRDKVFSEFFRSTRARQTKNFGSGIGLFLVKVVIDAHNGKIWFESEENKGTTFHVQIPLQNDVMKPEEKMEVFLKNV